MDAEGEFSMYRYTEMLLELGGFSGKLGRYYALLDVILVFMASYALVIFTGVHQICAEIVDVDIITFSEVGMEIAAPAVCAVLLAIAAMAPISILLVMFTRRRRDGVCASVGAAYPRLDEPLKTAYDNRGIENVVVDDLTEMVTAEMDEVAYSSFLNRKRITSRVVLIILLAFFIVSLAVANFSVAESARGVQLPLIGGGGSEGGGGGGDLTKGAGTGSKDIYGAPSVASIEGTNLDLTMYTGIGSEFSIRETSETEAHEFTESPAFPVEAAGSETSQEQIDDADLVGRYFEELAAAG
ncbi:MAG: hypothetical protein C4B59_09880 [Candidatus Methanogaster sp.]|uniref:Uncharacterized protein n=1 Tax=Candidatus Methanogaster sp. TaxID=3386292 RepID=A0AC61L2H3_9EURY|nr:MAG: hypothetical protein C4B59_09880 [ANME-2 cluster archaeon]